MDPRFKGDGLLHPGAEASIFARPRVPILGMPIGFSVFAGHELFESSGLFTEIQT